jgi:4'-phosphopantetheinyl transferase
MPVEKLIEGNGSRLCLWKISESLDELNHLILKKTNVRVFDNERRNRHYLSSRLLFESLLGHSKFSIVKDEHGKPHLQDGDYDISISHSGDYAVGMLSEKGSCGVDIERFRDKILAIAPRFCNEKELESIEPGNEIMSMYLIWSIKESLYKLYGRKSVNFKEHLHVGSYDINLQEGMVECWIKKNGTSSRYSVQFQFFEGYVLTWVNSVISA